MVWFRRFVNSSNSKQTAYFSNDTLPHGGILDRNIVHADPGTFQGVSEYNPGYDAEYLERLARQLSESDLNVPAKSYMNTQGVPVVYPAPEYVKTRQPQLPVQQQQGQQFGYFMQTPQIQAQYVRPVKESKYPVTPHSRPMY